MTSFYFQIMHSSLSSPACFFLDPFAPVFGFLAFLSCSLYSLQEGKRFTCPGRPSRPGEASRAQGEHKQGSAPRESRLGFIGPRLGPRTQTAHDTANEGPLATEAAPGWGARRPRRPLDGSLGRRALEQDGFLASHGDPGSAAASLDPAQRQREPLSPRRNGLAMFCSEILF